MTSETTNVRDPNWLDRLFLTKRYLATLTDEQIQLKCMSKKARMGYLNEKCDRAYSTALAAVRQLQSTCAKVSAESALVVPAHVYMAECSARKYAETRLCHWVDRATEAEDLSASLERRIRVERVMFSVKEDELIQQVDDLRNERNELLDCVHDLQQALKAVAPKGE